MIRRPYYVATQNSSACSEKASAKSRVLTSRGLSSRTKWFCATVVNWSDHPETLGRENTQIASDYPHWVRSYLEKRFGGTALFFGGSIGKVSPLGDQVALLDPETGKIAEGGTWRKAELLGNEIGRLSERALKSAEQVTPDSLSIQSATVFVPMHNPQFRVAESAGVFAGRKPLYTEGKSDYDRPHEEDERA